MRRWVNIFNFFTAMCLCCIVVSAREHTDCQYFTLNELYTLKSTNWLWNINFHNRIVWSLISKIHLESKFVVKNSNSVSNMRLIYDYPWSTWENHQFNYTRMQHWVWELNPNCIGERQMPCSHCFAIHASLIFCIHQPCAFSNCYKCSHFSASSEICR